MARLEVQGFDELNDAFGRIKDIPFEATAKALTAMGEAAAERIRQSGEAMGVRDPESQVHILDKIKVNKPKKTKSGGYVEITFSGTRTRGRTRTRNAEIAFINEYGKRSQPARPFIAKGMSQGEEAIVAPGADVIGDWIEKEFKG